MLTERTPMPPQLEVLRPVNREKALEEDRTNAQRELEHYEQEHVSVSHGGRVVRYWEVRTFVLLVLMGIRLMLMSSGRNTCSPLCFGLLWMSSLPKLLRSLRTCVFVEEGDMHAEKGSNFSTVNGSSPSLEVCP